MPARLRPGTEVYERAPFAEITSLETRAHGESGTAGRATRLSALPPSLAPGAINRVQAAEFVGVSPSKFDQMVEDRRMPKPRAIDNRRIWLVSDLTESLLKLPTVGGEDESNEWDEVSA